MTFTLEIIDGPTFYQEVYDNELRDKIKYLSHGSFHVGQEINIVCRSGRQVAGVAGLWPNPYDSRIVWMPFLTVVEEFRNQKVATMLARAVAEYVVGKGQSLGVSSYTPDGLKYLAKVFDRLKSEPNFAGRIVKAE